MRFGRACDYFRGVFVTVGAQPPTPRRDPLQAAAPGSPAPGSPAPGSPAPGSPAPGSPAPGSPAPRARIQAGPP